MNDKCKHHATEKYEAIDEDGWCPVCLAQEVMEMESALGAERKKVQDSMEWAKKMRQSYEDELSALTDKVKRMETVVEAARGLKQHGEDMKHGTHANILWNALAKLSSYNLSYVLAEQPSLATPELMAKLNPHSLSYVLARQPSLATPELMAKLNPDHLSYVLAEQPSLATPELMAKLNPHSLSYVLARQPSLATPELMAKLNPDHLSEVLYEQPSLATPELLAKLDSYNLLPVLARHPSLTTPELMAKLDEKEGE